jgi:hypothetical protein
LKKNIYQNKIELVEFSIKICRSGNDKAHLSSTSKPTSLTATTSKYYEIRRKPVIKKNLIISNCECESTSNSKRPKTEKHLAIINHVE